MSNRLTKIYTKTGDTGSTGLGDGTRTLKCSDRIEAIGTVDELNCVIGLLLCESLPDQVSDFLTKVQHQLFDLGSELSVPGYSAITDENIENIENELDAMNLNLEPLKSLSYRVARAHPPSVIKLGPFADERSDASFALSRTKRSLSSQRNTLTGSLTICLLRVAQSISH
jgi:hypothetical protein